MWILWEFTWWRLWTLDQRALKFLCFWIQGSAPWPVKSTFGWSDEGKPELSGWSHMRALLGPPVYLRWSMPCSGMPPIYRMYDLFSKNTIKLSGEWSSWIIHCIFYLTWILSSVLLSNCLNFILKILHIFFLKDL